MDSFRTLERGFDELRATAHANIGFWGQKGMAKEEGAIQRTCVTDGLQNRLPLDLVIPIHDVTLDDAEAWVGIQHCLNTKSCDGDAPTDANTILDWGHNLVVGVLEPVIEECPCEETPLRSADVDRLAVR